jgi:hypothetical protein
MIGWTSYSEVKMVKVLRRHLMDHAAVVFVIHAVHSIAATTSCNGRARKYKRKCGGSNESEVGHDSSPLGPKHSPVLPLGGGEWAATVQAT